MTKIALQIACGPRDDNGSRLVVATFNGQQHRDTFNTDGDWRRQKFREKVVEKFGLWKYGLPEAAHEFIESEIVAKADAADAEPAGAESPIVKLASEFKPRSVDWLWEGYLPAAALSLLEGDPGLGKSQLTCWLAAAVTTHRTMPDGSHVPDNRSRGVVLLSAEDDPERVIVPRLKAVGADLAGVHFFAGVGTLAGDDRPFTLPRDVGLLEQVVTNRGAALVIVDPLVAYLDANVSANSDADMRRATRPLAAMAERTGAAVLLLRHLNKKSGSSAMYRGGGSIGIVGAARAAFVVAEPEDDPGLRVMAPVKMNLAPKPRSQTFSIETVDSTSRVAWGKATDTTADDLLSAGDKRGKTTKVEQAKRIIDAVLIGGPRGEREVVAACEAQGISRSTYWKARKAIGVVSEKTAFAGEWMLSLPRTPDDSEEFTIPF